MKNPQKITRIHLSLNEQDEPALFGLVCSDPDYKLTLKINSTLNLSLKSSAPVTFSDNEGHQLVYSAFSDKNTSPDTVFHLFSNRSGKSFLIKKMVNIDFILLLHDPGKNFDIEKLTALLRGIDTVTAVFNFDFRSLKERNLKYLAL